MASCEGSENGGVRARREWGGADRARSGQADRRELRGAWLLRVLGAAAEWLVLCADLHGAREATRRIAAQGGDCPLPRVTCATRRARAFSLLAALMNACEKSSPTTDCAGRKSARFRSHTRTPEVKAPLQSRPARCERWQPLGRGTGAEMRERRERAEGVP